MVGYRRKLCALMLSVVAGISYAQNNTNSPYTRYGLGDLSGQFIGRSVAMGGVSIGIRDNQHINPLNPASYTAIDSLTFLFEGGVTLQNANFNDGTQRINAKNTSFDYVAMQFRLHKRIGFSLGVLPYSNVGYNVSQSIVGDDAVPSSTKQMYGEGGFHQLYAGLGVKLFENLSIGANVSFFWGGIDRNLTVIYPAYSTASGGTYPSYSEATALRVKDYKLDFGIQYTQPIGSKQRFTLGLTYSPSKQLNADADLTTTTSVVTSSDLTAKCGLPNVFGGGVSYTYDDRLTVAADYTLQKWSEVLYHVRELHTFADQSRISIGAEYLPSFLSRKYFGHVKYRLGAYYCNPYYETEKGERACRELGVTAGFGLPIPRTRSMFNIGIQYVNVKGIQPGMLNQNVVKLSLGITFNERWFFKRKVY